MINIQMNIEDIDKLNKFRMERLLSLFDPSLQNCIVHIDTDSTLSVYCPHPGILEELIDELDDLRDHAWFILGAREVMLYTACEKEEFLSDL